MSQRFSRKRTGFSIVRSNSDDSLSPSLVVSRHPAGEKETSTNLPPTTAPYAFWLKPLFKSAPSPWCGEARLDIVNAIGAMRPTMLLLVLFFGAAVAQSEPQAQSWTDTFEDTKEFLSSQFGWTSQAVGVDGEGDDCFPSLVFFPSLPFFPFSLLLPLQKCMFL